MPNKVYRALETPIVFRDSGGDYVLQLQNLAFGTGVISAQCNRGTGSKPKLHEVRGIVRFDVGAAIGEAIYLYLFESDGTYMNGTLGASATSMSADKTRNGHLIGAIIVDTTSADTDIIASFKDVPIVSQYYSIGLWNGSANRALKNTANASRIIVTPMPDEVQ